MDLFLYLAIFSLAAGFAKFKFQKGFMNKHVSVNCQVSILYNHSFNFILFVYRVLKFVKLFCFNPFRISLIKDINSFGLVIAFVFLSCPR